jgi:sec-independent protein translocase protein TatA
MGEFSPFHWLVVLAVVVLLFGGKKIPEVMRGIGEGIRSFKEGVRGDINSPAPPAQAPPSNTTPATPAATEKK